MSKTNGRSMPEGRPIQPGEVLNPHGRNQYSDLADFRGDVQRAAVALLSEQPGGGELEALGVPAAIRRLVPEGSDRGTAVVAVLYGMSLKGEAKAMQELLTRIWPAPNRHEIDLNARVATATFADLAVVLADVLRERAARSGDGRRAA